MNYDVEKGPRKRAFISLNIQKIFYIIILILLCVDIDRQRKGNDLVIETN